MRDSYGTSYGISLTLPADYEYLRFFDAKALEEYVDFFEFMSYDVQVGGSTVRGSTDVRVIKNDTLPLWYADLDPKKINFGLGLYGHGYTLKGMFFFMQLKENLANYQQTLVAVRSTVPPADSATLAHVPIPWAR